MWSQTQRFASPHSFVRRACSRNYATCADDLRRRWAEPAAISEMMSTLELTHEDDNDQHCNDSPSDYLADAARARRDWRSRDLLRYLHSEVKLSDRELERVTGVHRVTISRWRSAKAQSEPRDVGRLDDLRVIVGLMVNSRAFSAEEAGRFLRSRDPDLDHQGASCLAG